MRIKHYLAAAVMLALPNAALAQETPEGEPMQEPEGMPPQETPEETPQETPTQQVPAAESKMHAEVKGYVLPAAVGIRSAEMSASALEALAQTDQIRGKDVRKTADLAEESVKLAHESTQSLRDVRGLSEEVKAQIGMATRDLEKARETAKRIKRDVGKVEGVFKEDKAEKLRKDAQELSQQLSLARTNIKSAAERYKIETDFSQAM